MLANNDLCGKHTKVFSFIVMSVAFGFFVVYYAMKMSQPNLFCDPGPYIYATFHDEAANILKYSRNGCLLDAEVLSGKALGKLAGKACTVG